MILKPAQTLVLTAFPQLGGLVALLQGFQPNDTTRNENSQGFSRFETSPRPLGLCRAKTSSGRFCERYGARVMGSRAFTLAEVLITLGVIGVVAALTIPNLVTNIQSKVTEHQRKVANARLVEGLNMLNIKENGLSVRYNNTEEFVRALGKHMKLVQICGKNNLTDCFPYESINYNNAQGQAKQVRVDSLTSAPKLKLYDEGWLDPAGFITANGIPYIISFNNNCSNSPDIDPDRQLKDIPYQCIDGIYDLNGTKSPNKMSKDVESLNSASVYRCVKEIGDFCLLTKAFKPNSVSYNDCETKYKRTLVSNCYQPWNSSTQSLDPPSDKDSWLGGMVACKKSGGHMPSPSELSALISSFYSDSNGNHPEIPSTSSWFSPCANGESRTSNTSCPSGYLYQLNGERLTELNLPSSDFNLWSSWPNQAYGAIARRCNVKGLCTYGNYGRENITAICISD